MKTKERGVTMKIDCVPTWMKEPEIQEIGVYWMVGVCGNCGAKDILMRFLKERDARHGQCPVCGVGDDSQYGWRGVGPRRLATLEEIPAQGL